MSAKLDKSLDELLTNRRDTARRGGRRAGGGGPRNPSGGVRKNATKPAAPKPAAQTPAPGGKSGESKIMVSGLVSLFFPFQPELNYFDRC